MTIAKAFMELSFLGFDIIKGAVKKVVVIANQSADWCGNPIKWSRI